MTQLIVTLLGLSVLALLVPVVILVVGKLVKKPSCITGRKTQISPMLLISVCMIGSVWCLRYAVGYYTIAAADPAQFPLTWWEEIFNSMVHTLKTFSMDEDYTRYILDGKQMLRQMFGKNTLWQTVYSLYASILNFAAPVAGGAIILDVLASVFPKLRLFFSGIAIWREKYYFSELNQASVVLAKSVFESNRAIFRKPVIIFSDAYVNADDEKCAELLLDAKAIGAICVRDDLSHVRKNRLGRRKFFLIDELESENLHTLTELASDSNCFSLKKAEIYLFTNDDAYVQLEEWIRDKLTADKKFKEDELPVLIPVQSNRNLITNMLVELPLFEPLIGKKKKTDGTTDLSVTILGTGGIGTDMFLSTYWIGQILDCNLKINVFSLETEEEFWSKLDCINPEIRRTTIADDPILRINRKGDMSPVYCQVNYRQCDVASSAFVQCLQGGEASILDTDYYFVSLGTDEANISTANMIKRYVGQHHIAREDALRAVICYVVFAPELAQTLNRKKRYCFTADKADIYMNAVGSLEDVYSVRNVFMTEHETVARKAHSDYLSRQGGEQRAKIHKKRIANDYNHWANLARAMHIKYKVFSMGMLETSVLDYTDATEKDYGKYLEQALEKYKKAVSGQMRFDDPKEAEAFVALLHRMSWLEHRRWCAFTRVKGFQSTQNYDRYVVAGKKGSYKQMELKLHPCLVECDQKGIRAAVAANGQIDPDTILKCTDESDFDLLDELTYALYRAGHNQYDFKQYDYPFSDF